MPPPIAVIVCHYNPDHSFFLRSLALLCVSSILKDPAPDIQVFLCDGSPEPDPVLEAEVVRYQVIYLHAGQKLSFGETYNLGIKNSDSDYVVLVANDIQITSAHIKKLVGEITDNIACTIPYLTEADYLTQKKTDLAVPYICFPASMTINVNAFRRTTLNKIGYVPEELSGFFNDIVMFGRMRAIGCRIGLVNVGKVHHLGKVTRKYSSNVRWDEDIKVALSLIPALVDKQIIKKRALNSYLAEIYSLSAQTALSKLLWKLFSILPFKLEEVSGIALTVAKIEPYISADSTGFSRGLATIGSNIRNSLWKKSK